MKGGKKLIDLIAFFKKWGIGTLPKFDIIKNYLLNKLQNGRLEMKKDIYSNIKDSDALESFLNV